MPHNFDDTIFALATGAGAGAIAIVRVSGRNADSLLAHLGVDALPTPRVGVCRPLYDQSSSPHELIDQALVLRFLAPASYTGEDMVELQCHGGTAVIARLLDVLYASGLARMADAGEFTKRAYHNQKMHLTKAEAINDLINAKTTRQHAQAIGQMRGGLHSALEDLMDGLRRALAHLEAYIDFPDEELPTELAQQVTSEVLEIRNKIDQLITASQGAIRLRDGLRVAIVGATNVGKSTLINQLVKRDVAIVNERAGTTRDSIEIALEIDGFPIIIVDTAGVRATQDDVEKQGIARTYRMMGDADFRIVLCGCDQPDSIALAKELYQDGDLFLMNRSDLRTPDDVPQYAHPMSLKTGDGVASFDAALVDRIHRICGQSDNVAGTRLRHLYALQEASVYVGAFVDDDTRAIEFLCEDLRLGLRALGRVVGSVDVEDLLDIIFKDFCLGK